MSKSQIKRLHQQQEAEKVNLVDEEEEKVEAQRKGPANRFAFFDDEEVEDPCNSDRANSDEEGRTRVEQASEKKNKKKNRKNKKKTEKKTEEHEETENQMLARLAAANLKAAKTAGNDSSQPSVENLMKIDLKLFDMSAELKRKLGGLFKETTAPGEQSEDNRWPPGRRSKGRIVKNRPRWHPENDCGLSMVQVKEEDGAVWFKLKHNNHYEQRERMFWLSEANMNVEAMHEICFDTPYHLNSLLVLAHVSRIQEDLNKGIEMIEQGIFYVDQYAAAGFEPFNWRHRMDYTDYENRVFYLLLHRHMLNAAQKRCWDTALNTAKLVFKLDPVRDPLAIMSIIDIFALKAKQYTWIIQMFEAGKKFKKLHLLPNWPYSVALAKFFTAKTEEERENAENELHTAIRHFPSVVVQLMDLMQIHPDSAVMNCKMLTSFVAENEKDSLKVLMKIYTKQTEDVWKMPDVLLFLEKCARHVALSNDTESQEECDEWRIKRSKMYHGRSPNVDRLGMLLDVIPSTSVTDPVPPANGRCGYEKDGRLLGQHTVVDDSFFGAFIHSLLPYFDTEESLQNVLDRHREELVNILANNFHNARDQIDQIGEAVRNWARFERPHRPDDGNDDENREIPHIMRLDDEEVEFPDDEESQQQ